jgi:hypothetical protein
MQGCQMVCFQTKNPNLGKIWTAFKENVGMFYGHLEYIAAIGCILWPFGNLVAIWSIFPCCGILWQEKSGNPDLMLSGKRCL